MVLVVVSGLTIGCSSKAEITITTEELREGIAAAVDVQTYSFNLRINREIHGDGWVGNESTETSIVMDRSNKKFHRIITEDREYEGVDAPSIHTQGELYSIDNISYFKNSSTDYLWRKSVWSGPAEDNEEWWEDYQHDSIREQFSFLEYSEIEITDIETINGVECWVVKVLPNSQLYSNLTGMDEQDIEGLSVKQWFANDTYFLMKAQMEWKNVLAPYEVLREIEFSHYNESVSIELPAEAEAAEEAE